MEKALGITVDAKKHRIASDAFIELWSASKKIKTIPAKMNSTNSVSAEKILKYRLEKSAENNKHTNKNVLFLDNPTQ